MGSALLPGKLGVYASHLAVWEAFLASDYDIALILEDDVVFHDDFPEALPAAITLRLTSMLGIFSNCVASVIHI